MIQPEYGKAQPTPSKSTQKLQEFGNYWS